MFFSAACTFPPQNINARAASLRGKRDALTRRVAGETAHESKSAAMSVSVVRAEYGRPVAQRRRGLAFHGESQASRDTGSMSDYEAPRLSNAVCPCSR